MELWPYMVAAQVFIWTISILTHFWGERSVALFYLADFSLNLFLSSSPLASYRSFWFLSRADFRFLNV